MVRRTLLVSIASFALYLTPEFLFFYGRRNSASGARPQPVSEAEFFIYALQLWGLLFLTLLGLNLLFRHRYGDRPKAEQRVRYALLGGLLSLAPVLALLLFQFLQRGHVIPEAAENEYYHLRPYATMLVLPLLTLRLNRRVVWKNFE